MHWDILMENCKIMNGLYPEFTLQECCYSNGSLLEESGFLRILDAAVVPPLYDIGPLDMTDQEGYDLCCVQSFEFCQYFYTVRPHSSCVEYNSPRFGELIYGEHSCMDTVFITMNCY